MLSPLTIVSLDQGKFYPREPQSSLEADLAAARPASRMSVVRAFNAIVEKLLVRWNGLWTNPQGQACENCGEDTGMHGHREAFYPRAKRASIVDTVA
ncbi:hypothetical protein [Rhizobium herbae]|uniref:Transposase n=1 Tax=Rhizobium herbae TaxID=508661 RepID=A0ABS4EQR1_9HYPH|nr:hypothetical protein [Rhizobium herbae]MBP1860290.1 hypothetical protein [Rhizobium herbae]